MKPELNPSLPCEPPPPRGAGGDARDARLDFWRGLCLVDMVLVHLAYANLQFGPFLSPLLTDYLRFAAGGFVFTSGLCVGTIFLPKAVAAARDAGSPMPMYVRLWRRMGRLLGVQYVAYVAFVLMQAARGFGDPALARPVRFVFETLACRRGNDLLLLYVAMMAAAPLMLELIRRRLWWVVALLSAAGFAVGTWRPWLVAFVDRGHFPPLLWQLPFVAGVLGSRAMPWFDRGPRSRRILVTSAAFLAFAVVFESAHADALGLPPLLPLRFWKVPLTLGEALRYLTLVVLLILTTSLAWGRLRRVPGARWVCLLGRNSLLVYVAHLFLQEWVMALAYRTWGLGLWQIAYAVAAVVLLAGVAYGVEQVGKQRKTGAHREAAGSAALPARGSLLAE